MPSTTNGKIFSDETFAAVIEGYRRGSFRKRALIWFYASCAVFVSVSAILSVIWIVGIAVTHDAPAPAKVEVKEEHPAHVEPFHPVYYEVENFNMSFGKKRGMGFKYAQSVILLKCDSQEILDWMKINRAVIRDAVFSVGITQHAEKLKTNEGLDKFGDDILKELQKRFKEKAPSAVIFKKWLIK